MPVRFVACTVLILAGAPTARAAEAAPPAPAAPAPHFNLMGPSSCAGWPRSGTITSAGKAVPLNWALGFLSGAAARGDIALLDLFEPESVDAWLTDYCKAHPADNLPLAVRTLQHELEARLPPPPPPPGPPMFVPPAATPAPDAKPAPAKRAPIRRKAAPKT